LQRKRLFFWVIWFFLYLLGLKFVTWNVGHHMWEIIMLKKHQISHASLFKQFCIFNQIVHTSLFKHFRISNQIVHTNLFKRFFHFQIWAKILSTSMYTCKKYCHHINYFNLDYANFLSQNLCRVDIICKI